MTAELEVFTVGGPGVAWRETGGEIVILDLTGSVYFGLNGTGARLWKRMLNGASKSDLVAQLIEDAQDWDVSMDADVEGFLADLDRFGLLNAR